MKKLFLAVVLLLFVSSVPSFALKTIYNTENDRTVPSRSGYANYYQDVDYSQNYGQKTVIPDAYSRYLGEYIRPELRGTVWYYYTNVHNVSNSGAGNASANAKKAFNAKPYIREAADYFVHNDKGNYSNYPVYTNN